MFLVSVVSDAVGVSNEVEPVDRESFAEVRRGEQAIDHADHAVATPIGKKCIDLIRRRRKASEIEREPADQGDVIGPAARRDLVLGETPIEMLVDRISAVG